MEIGHDADGLAHKIEDASHDARLAGDEHRETERRSHACFELVPWRREGPSRRRAALRECQDAKCQFRSRADEPKEDQAAASPHRSTHVGEYAGRRITRFVEVARLRDLKPSKCPL